jgi:hypothetical protein
VRSKRERERIVDCRIRAADEAQRGASVRLERARPLGFEIRALRCNEMCTARLRIYESRLDIRRA